MVRDLYSVFDKASEQFQLPWAARTEGEAVRVVRDGLVASSAMRSHHADLTLLHVGQWDDSKGEFVLRSRTVVSSVSAIEAMLPPKEASDVQS